MAAARLLASERRPTALFVANIRAAIGTLAAARRLGLGVPSDLSVIGFHDAPVAAYTDPPLSTVRMPLREMGAQAVDTLLRLLDGGEVDDVRVGEAPEIVVRASASPLEPGLIDAAT